MATANIILYRHKTLNDGTHPVIVQVIHNRKIKRLSISYSCQLEQWNMESNRFRKNYPGYGSKNIILTKYASRIDDILDDFNKSGKPFTFQVFEQKFRKTGTAGTVYDFFDILITELNDKGKIGNKKVYKDAKRAVQKFNASPSLMFPDIDYKFLSEFEVFLYKNGCTGGGISVFMRTFRAVINEAIRRGYMERELYPFTTSINKNGYSVSHLKSKPNPRALSSKDLEKLKKFKYRKHPELAKAVKYFLFSYYARGMNFTDMAKLKWSDVYDGRMNYIRAKTGGSFNIRVTDKLKGILKYFGSDSKYIFPILTEFHKTPNQVKDRILKCLGEYNKELKRVAAAVGISTPLSSYVSRHSYAQALKRGHIDIALISQNMGHKNASVTTAYLKNFEDEEADKADEVL